MSASVHDVDFEERSRTLSPTSRSFSALASYAAHATGRASAFVVAVLIVLVWGITGPLFNFSDTWQLVINTGTTIVTFLMVFLIQNSQNRDGAAIQVKLDEIIRTGRAANYFVGIEHLTEEEIEELREKCERYAQEKRTQRVKTKKVKSQLSDTAR